MAQSLVNIKKPCTPIGIRALSDVEDSNDVLTLLKNNPQYREALGVSLSTAVHAPHRVQTELPPLYTDP